MNNIPFSLLATLPAPAAGLSLGEQLAHTIAKRPWIDSLLACLPSTTQPAILSPSLSRPPLTHAQLRHAIANFRLPSSSPNVPLGCNDRVAVVLPTGPENALAILSISAYYTCAPMNASCTAQELLEDSQRLRIKAIVTTADAEQRLELHHLRQKLGCEIIYLTPRQSGPAGLFELSLINQPDWKVASRSKVPAAKLHGLDDYSLILHTSGTSGKKKVVPYTLRSLIIGTLAVVKSWGLRADDVNMNMMPLFHVGGIIRNLWAPVFSGGSTIMCSAFDAATFWTLTQHLGATWYYAAPTMHHAILASRPEDVDPSHDTRIRLICNAAGGLLPTLAQELRNVFGGCTVLPSYGMTECMPIASPPPSYRLDRPGCSGVACGPHLSIRNPANTNEGLAVGKTGAICVRGLPTFEGYEVSPNGPLDTSAFSKDGWFDSGDCGWMDADGYLYITGRSKEIINKGGEVISPFEIEEAVMSVAKDRIRATLAFVIEHDVLQEHIGLIVVPALGQTLIGLTELHDRLREHLHPSKWPFIIVYMTDIPKNDTGKPLRIGLAPRLKLGAFTDDIPAFHRHFEAQCPRTGAPLSQPIDCSMLVVNEQQVVRSMKTISGIRDVALRFNVKNIEAFASVFNDTLDSKRIARALINVLPGYAIPAVIHVWTQPILRLSSGKVDFDGMERELQSRQASIMTHEQTVVRDIIARLLMLEPKVITADSDFFLLGGNSMLVGRLAHAIRKETGMDVEISALFTNSTVRGIASMLKGGSLGSSRGSLFDRTLVGSATPVSASTAHWATANWAEPKERRRGWTHPVSLIVQSIPFIFFYPLKIAWKWTLILFILSYMHAFINASFWPRAGTLLFAVMIARGTSYILTPITAIIFKWLVIGFYQPGVYPMWSTYHLRWWIVNQSLRIAGRGVFGMHPTLERLYMQLLGARVGSNVRMNKLARFGEYDLLDIGDNCLIDKAIVRGFCVERDGYFRLGRITIGNDAVINTYTQIAPDTEIADGQVFGPHASSHDDPSDPSSAIYNSSAVPRPRGFFTSIAIFVFLALVKLVTYIPWFIALYLMIQSTVLRIRGLNNLESVIWWFADPERVLWHAVGRVMRAVVQPLLQVFLGIIFKRLMGLNREGLHADSSQWSIIRRHINSQTLSQSALRRAFDILGSHYQMTTWIWRAMGARIGKRVYWPGSGITCPDPELLEVGDDVVFGSRSELLTSDGLGSKKIKIEAGAMIADRVVLLAGTHVGSRTVMGSGSLSIRDGYYRDGSIWMGAQNGEAVCLSRGNKEKDIKSDTITPFGRAYYNREADYFVTPYIGILFIGVFTATLSAIYWAISAVAVAQVLRQLQIHLHQFRLFKDTWYRFGLLYGLIAICFICVLNIQAILAMAWVVLTKWLVIGRRKEGSYVWDKSNYCQRWQLHLALSGLISKGFGSLSVLDPLTGTVFIAWYYRALGAKVGKNCSIGASGHTVLMTEPDLVELGDDVSLDDCSVVAHINSRGIFALNRLQIGNGCALRSGSRLLSGASMEENSMLLEHTLLASGEVAEAGELYAGWPARRLLLSDQQRDTTNYCSSVTTLSE